MISEESNLKIYQKEYENKETLKKDPVVCK